LCGQFFPFFWWTRLPFSSFNSLFSLMCVIFFSAATYSRLAQTHFMIKHHFFGRSFFFLLLPLAPLGCRCSHALFPPGWLFLLRVTKTAPSLASLSFSSAPASKLFHFPLLTTTFSPFPWLNPHPPPPFHFWNLSLLLCGLIFKSFGVMVAVFSLSWSNLFSLSPGIPLHFNFPSWPPALFCFFPFTCHFPHRGTTRVFSLGSRRFSRGVFDVFPSALGLLFSFFSSVMWERSAAFRDRFSPGG